MSGDRVSRPPISLLTQARGLLADASTTPDAGERFRLAHLAALRIAAAVLAGSGSLARSRRRLVSVWPLLEKTAPEHAARARYFASGAAVRAAVETGAPTAVSALTADEQLRAATDFLLEVEATLGLLAA